MAGSFELKRTSDSQFMFNLKAGNHEVILTSERYTQKQNALKGIDSVRVNAPLDERYERKSSGSQFYFVLRAANSETLGHSEMYTTKDGMEKGIRSVKENAPDAAVNDKT